MTKIPTFKLSRLREIGWRLWDPIGVSGLEDNAADEYDSYLLQAAGRLWNGASEDEVTDYLVTIETEHMGLDETPAVRPQARKVVEALNDYISELRS